MALYLEDTIAAIVTAPGPGAITILRISGRDALGVGRRILRRPAGRPWHVDADDSHRARRARLVRPDHGSEIDDVLVLPMLGPRSYTGEDTVEIQCHGGRVLADLALRAALQAGARAARPGEFTERAFLNGRLDLCQAEAVGDLIAASSEAALEAARLQLGGALSTRVAAAREQVLDARALVEAHLDFPEEDLPGGVEAELRQQIGSVEDDVRGLASTYARGRLVREGIRIVLAGRPNVGKSSLLNALLGRDRALVSAEAGTTRDYLEEPAALGAMQVLLCDTAGLRDAAGDIERAGVTRTTERIAAADVLVLVLDGSRALEPSDRTVFDQLPDRPLVLVRNKADLPPAWETPGAAFGGSDPVPVSATEGTGLEELAAALLDALPEGPSQSYGLVVTNARHHEALTRSADHLAAASSLLRERRELELVAAELQLGCGALDEIVGRSDCEDVLDRIFSRFCVGK